MPQFSFLKRLDINHVYSYSKLITREMITETCIIVSKVIVLCVLLLLRVCSDRSRWCPLPVVYSTYCKYMYQHIPSYTPACFLLTKMFRHKNLENSFRGPTSSDEGIWPNWPDCKHLCHFSCLEVWLLELLPFPPNPCCNEERGSHFREGCSSYSKNL